MTGRADPARAWSTLRAELPLPSAAAPDVVVLRLRVAADCDVELVASLSSRRRRQQQASAVAAAPPSGGGSTLSPVVWRRRRNSESAAANTGASGAADEHERDLGLLVLEEMPSIAAARHACAAAPPRTRASIEATGMRILPFTEPGEELRGVGHDEAMAECRLAGPNAGHAGESDDDSLRTYFVVVLALGGLGEAAAAPPTALLEVHCSGAVLAECVMRPRAWLGRTLVARTLALDDAVGFEESRRSGAGGVALPEAEQRALGAAHAVFAHMDGGGAVFAAVNRHPLDAFVARSTVETAGDPLVVRRGTGARSGPAATSDVLPPLHAQLLQVATYRAAGRSLQVSSGRTTGPGAAAALDAGAEHGPPLDDTLHSPFPLFVP